MPLLPSHAADISSPSPFPLPLTRSHTHEINETLLLRESVRRDPDPALLCLTSARHRFEPISILYTVM